MTVASRQLFQEAAVLMQVLEVVANHLCSHAVLALMLLLILRQQPAARARST